jgi:hypothetical protein
MRGSQGACIVAGVDTHCFTGNAGCGFILLVSTFKKKQKNS